ncbi:MAG TPA: universal stress protein [Stellaceae bacterium]|nr:universal stress protein [Stellaceae bacterium]
MTLRIVAVLTAPDTTALCLDAAAQAAAVSPDAAVEAFHPRLAPESFILPSEEVMTELRRSELTAMLDGRSGAIRQSVQDWMSAAPGRSADWREAEGDRIGPIVAEQGRAADLVVLVRPGEAEGDAALHAAIFATGKPLLLVPPTGAGRFGRHMAVAWKASDPAARALAAAVPWLKCAAKVSVLTAGGAGDTDEATALLAGHGISAETLRLERDGEDVADRLLHEAHTIGADSIVMGAYRHSQLRELILGGVTRHMLQHADLPLFMAH